jgi:hypothetical protein
VALRTSTQAGNLSNAATWGGSAFVDGDYVSIGHAVTQDVDAIYGDSPSDTTTIVIDITAGSFSVAAGKMLTLRGNAKQADVVVTWAAGSGLTFDAHLAVTPTTNYKWNVGTAGNQTNCNVICNGTAGSHVTFTSNGGGGNGSFVSGFGGSFNSAHINATYVDWSSVGTASISCFQHYQRYHDIILDHCTFTACGQFEALNSNGISTLSLRHSYCLFTGSLNASPVKMLYGVAPTAPAVYQVDHCIFDTKPNWVVGRLAVTDTYIATGYLVAGTGANFTSFKRCLVRQVGSISGMDLYAGDTSDLFFLADTQTGNPHTSDFKAAGTYTGYIYEYTGARTADSGDILTSDNLALTVQNFIILPAADGNETVTLANFGGGGPAKYYHNTFFQGQQGGMCIGDFTQAPGGGTYAEYKSNLGWVNNGFVPTSSAAQLHFFSAHHGSNPALDVQDVLTGGGAVNNACWNFVTGYSRATQFPGVAGKGYQTNTTVAPGQNDIDLGTGGSGPNFVDSTRNLATYDSAASGLNNSATAWVTAHNYAVGDMASAQTVTFYGNAVINFRCVLAHTSNAGNATNGQPGDATVSWRTNWELATLYRLRADMMDAVFTAMMTWIRAGYAPRNSALKDAGHDGVTIGAVEGRWSSGGMPYFARLAGAGNL